MSCPTCRMTSRSVSHLGHRNRKCSIVSGARPHSHMSDSAAPIFAKVSGAALNRSASNHIPVLSVSAAFTSPIYCCRLLICSSSLALCLGNQQWRRYRPANNRRTSRGDHIVNHNYTLSPRDTVQVTSSWGPGLVNQTAMLTYLLKTYTLPFSVWEKT
jgi:hypothetical protein